MTNKLKCYFAFSNDISNKHYYVEMLKACLESARKNTTLDLHCLYDGNKEDDLYDLLLQYNVKVKIASIPFYDKLSGIYTKEYMLDKFGFIISENSMRSRFLRMMISEYENDEYFLYCDTDLLFLKDITLNDFPCLPKTVAVCPEFEKSDNYDFFNAGVMLINTPVAKEKYKTFINMIENGIKAQTECCDQGYLNDLYRNQFDKLPLEYNWKPYWGINENTKILHFHGIKPNEDINTKIDFLKAMLSENDSVAAYYHYYDLYCDYININKESCLNKLSKALLINFPINKPNKKFRKTHKIAYLSFILNIVSILCLLIFFLWRL